MCLVSLAIFPNPEAIQKLPTNNYLISIKRHHLESPRVLGTVNQERGIKIKP
jgi:hypothetical protein